MITEDDWNQLFSSDGYILMKKRLDRVFTDNEFKTFVLSDSLLNRLQDLTTSIEELKKLNVKESISRVMLYLPEHTKIKAKTVFLLITPSLKANGWVYMDTSYRQAIFLTLDGVSRFEKYENLLVHELFHAGYHPQLETADTSLRTFFIQILKLSEGFATLAAAGGPEIHPHAFSKADRRANWDNNMKNFNADLKRINQFILDIYDKKLKSEEIDQIDSSLHQGPWYTIGWKTAVTIERAFGRAKLIQCLSKPRSVFSIYNEAASRFNHSHADSLALWSPTLIKRVAK